MVVEVCGDGLKISFVPAAVSWSELLARNAVDGKFGWPVDLETRTAPCQVEDRYHIAGGKFCGEMDHQRRLTRPQARLCINPGQNRCHGVAIMDGLGGPMSCATVTG